MSHSAATRMQLMAYADGELAGDELEEVERLLAIDTEAVRFVEQISGLGEIVAEGYDAGAGAAVSKVDMVDLVMSRVAKESAPKMAQVASLDHARKKRGGVGVGAGVVAALALAASIFLFARHRTDETPMAAGPRVAVATHASTTSPASPHQPAPAATVVAEAPANTNVSGVDVSTVNSPGNSVSVFYLPTANSLSTSVVVWVDETGEK